MSTPAGWKGRGSASNPPNRFELRTVEPDPEAVDPLPSPRTQAIPDRSRSVLTRNDSPDIGYTWSLNPYRGCEHGCVYCYARPYHEYLGYSLGLDFETKIVVTEDAPELLRAELRHRSWVPDVVALGSVTDAYQPLERDLRLTRRCLEVFTEFRNPVGIVTKNALVTRDLDLLGELAQVSAALVMVSVTTLDAELAASLEPRASRPTARLNAVRTLREAGVPVGVMVAPVIPGLNDHEIPSILAAAHEAGAQWATYVVVRLSHGLGDLFSAWLERHRPGSRDKILGRIASLHGGQLHDSRSGVRMTGEGALAQQIRGLFRLGCRRVGLSTEVVRLSAAAFRGGPPVQKLLFDL